MTRMSPRIGLFAAFGLLTGCVAQPLEDESIAQAEQAVNVCNATPAANLYVDGIPAYAQCTASTSSAIYSNNGVDTATSSQGSDWVRTQYSGGYQCTELVHRYWLFKWKITWIPNGNAGTWCNTTPSGTSGIVQTTTPVHGDAIVFAPGSCGADSTTGHVALVDTVDTAASKVTFVEQNSAGRRSGAWSCAACFLHVVANNGSAGATGTGGTASGTGGATSSTGGTGVGMGGTAPSTGGSTAIGGRNNLGGGTSMATGGSTSNTGGAAASNGGTSANTGGRSTGGATTAPATGGATTATGGSNSSPNGGTSSSTGGASTGSGGANVVSTGGTSSTGTPPNVTGGSVQGGSAFGGESSVAAGGQTVTPGTDSPDPDSGCSCSVPRTRGMSQALGWFGVVLTLLGRRRYRRGRASR